MKELFMMYRLFFKMGAETFGGGYAMLPILKREVVENKQWLTEEQVMDFYAISQGLPGIIAANVAVFIGYFHRKTAGAVAAILGVVSPCIIIITVIAACLSNFQDNVYVSRALSAVSVCVIALILDALLGMWKKGVKDLFGFLIFAVTLIAMIFTEISPVLLVIVSALLGIYVRSRRGGQVS